jgi:hypothetical protein
MGRPKAKATSEQANGGVFLRGAKEFRHDLFKSDVQKMKRNTSFQKGVVKIVELEHAHVYHSHNSQGKAQEFTATVGGHFHQIVESGTDPNGKPWVKCGPPLMEKFLKRRGGQKRVKLPVEWHDDDGKKIADTHTHEMVYEGSEYLSDRKVRAIQAQTQKAVSDALPEIQRQHEDAASGGDDGVSIEDVSQE